MTFLEQHFYLIGLLQQLEYESGVDAAPDDEYANAPLISTAELAAFLKG